MSAAPVAPPKVWVPKLYGKQDTIFNVGSREQSAGRAALPWCVLVSGSRYSLKTWGTLHRVVRHLWETPGARVAMFAKWMKQLTDGGSYTDLINHILPEWITGGTADVPVELRTPIGMEFTTFDRNGVPGPQVDSRTRTIFFRVRNMYGGESELRLFSLANDSEVASRLKNLSFSMIYFSELTNFGNPDIIRAAMWQLRMGHLQAWQQMLIADTNPSEDGEDSWIYRQFFLRQAVEGDEQDMKAFLQNSTVLQLFLRDNPLISAERKEHFAAMCRADPGVHAREIEGKWTKGHGNKGKHFADLYSPAVHVVGGGEGEQDTIDLLPTTSELFTGWDLGSINHAAAILEKRVAAINGRDVSLWIVHDEMVSVGEQVQLEEFTRWMLDKMREIETRAGHKLQWPHHWSDDSALNVFRNTGAGTDALEVQIHSKGEINLEAVLKPDGSVKSRVRLLRRLLRENRFFVAKRCSYTQRMLLECRTGSREKEYVAWDQNKHIFDAVTYPIFMESAAELIEEAFKPTGTPTPRSNMVSVNLNPVF